MPKTAEIPTRRTTLALPAQLLNDVDRMVQDGKAKSRNDFVALALRRSIADLNREAIDAAFDAMGNDEEYGAEDLALMREFEPLDREAALKMDADE